MNGQTDGCSGPLTEDGLSSFTLINLCLTTAFVCLLEGHCVRLVIFLYLVFFFFPQVFGIGFSLVLASVCSHLTEGLVSYFSLRDQTLGEPSRTWILELLRLEITLCNVNAKLST